MSIYWKDFWHYDQLISVYLTLASNMKALWSIIKGRWGNYKKKEKWLPIKQECLSVESPSPACSRSLGAKVRCLVGKVQSVASFLLAHVMAHHPTQHYMHNTTSHQCPGQLARTMTTQQQICITTVPGSPMYHREWCHDATTSVPNPEQIDGLDSGKS